MESYRLEAMTMDAGNSLLVLSECRSALAEAKTFEGVKEIRDKAEATRLLLQIRGESVATQNEAAEVAILAEIRLGEAIAAMTKRAGARDGKKTELHDVTPLLCDMGIEKQQSHRWQSMAAAKGKVAALRREADEQDKELTRAAVYKLGRTILTGGSKPAPSKDTWNAGDWISHLRKKVEGVYQESPADFRSMMANVLRSLAENVEAWESTEDDTGRGVGEEASSAA